MLMNRHAIVTCAAFAVLTVATSTAAEARGRSFFSLFCHVRDYAGIAQSHNPARVASARKRHDDGERPAKAVKSAQVAKLVKTNNSTVAPTTPAAVANAAVFTVAAATTTATCLTKEYLDTGAVMFKDTCTGEWAINSTAVDSKGGSVVRSCLTKDNNQNGVVVFKDTCTNEWAMNTSEKSQSLQTQ